MLRRSLGLGPRRGGEAASNAGIVPFAANPPMRAVVAGVRTGSKEH